MSDDRQVTPNLRNTVDCPDGCGKHGTPIKSRKGHIRGCPCAGCRAGRNSSMGKARQRRFAKEAGITQPKHRAQLGHEENWRDPLRWEVKSGKQVDPIITRFTAARDQSEVSRPIGDHRPFAMGVVPTSSSEPSLVIIDVETWATLIRPQLGEAS